jgi:hypothetical protein
MATPTNMTSTNTTPSEPAKTERGPRSVVETVCHFRHVRRRDPHAHASIAFAGRRARPRATAVSRATNTNVALAGLQIVIGYQWLVSGGDKILLGAFPAQVGPLLMGQISSGKLPAVFAALMRVVVVPNAPVFGYAIMLGETLAGLGLVTAGVFNFLRPLFEARAHGRLWELFALTDRLVTGMAPVAALGAGLLGVTYYALDGAPTIWFTPSLAYGGAIAPALIVALASLVLVAAQVTRPRPGR